MFAQSRAVLQAMLSAIPVIVALAGFTVRDSRRCLPDPATARHGPWLAGERW